MSQLSGACLYLGVVDISDVPAIKEFNYDNLNIRFSLEGITFNVVYLRSSSYVSFPMHHHAAFEIRCILSDNEVIFAENTKYNLKSGMISVAGPTIWHQQSSIDGKPFYAYTICLDVSETKKEDMSLEGDQAIIYEIFMSKLFWVGEDKNNCRAILEKIVDEVQQKNLGYFSMVKNYLREFIINLVRNYVSNSVVNIQSTYEMSLKTISEQRMHLLDMALIRWQPSLDELANMLGLGAKQTERLFLKFYNKTYAQKKLEMNLRSAAHMLLTTDMTAADICKESRFRTVGYFYRVFKITFGKTPMQYKLEAKNNQTFTQEGGNHDKKTNKE
jgi:AraC-like DNA-binding protein